MKTRVVVCFHSTSPSPQPGLFVFTFLREIKKFRAVQYYTQAPLGGEKKRLDLIQNVTEDDVKVS